VRQFPFIPKSNSAIKPGDFWPIQLVDKSLAVGRVIQLPSRRGPGSRSLFLAGLMDWHGNRPPCAADLAGPRVLQQAQMGIAAFQFTAERPQLAPISLQPADRERALSPHPQGEEQTRTRHRPAYRLFFFPKIASQLSL
jgi:hypothetical protein